MKLSLVAAGLVCVVAGLAATPAGAQVFTSTSSMTGYADYDNTNLPASGSPSLLNVSGMDGAVTDVNVLLKIASADDTSYFDWALTSPDGLTVMLLSDCGSYTSGFSNYNIFLDQSSPNIPTWGTAYANDAGATGTWQPHNCSLSTTYNGDDFPGVLPSADLTANLNRFNGGSANGQWRLMSGGSGAPGSQSMTTSGWALELTTTGPADTTKPTVTRPSVSGRTLGYRLSEAATLRFLVDRGSAGVKRKTKCVKRKRHQKGKRCTRWSPLPGSITTLAMAGDGTFAWDGKLAGKRLAAGRYRFTMTATDAAGNESGPVIFKVTVKKPKKR